ncbi:calpain-like protein fragment, putative [Trypanosoma brucei gambiense DAL972]|uniref:Calpain-like protein, putative n=1 Tax=Trypanosoma brucei gambiense (strain MHOM/CI/86/DAL972) TaxID=679716 RepID=C9ZIF5_TRYB9|nr:calpain-like protein fragment, putative [Trypanosoma brucei gambiense DAL972]CBH08947.1 calpain-like protein fragment, putative [Trypanosoma brucei gambiense DAL972]
MGCGGSKTSTVEFINGQPTVEGDEIAKGFNEGNGLLFRIVKTRAGRWAYYNDTLDYDMHVKVTFSEDCRIKALGQTRLEKLESGESVATVVVKPCATELFIEGHVNGYKAKMDAIPITDGDRQ